MSGMNKQLLQDLMQNIEARKQTEQRLKATVRTIIGCGVHAAAPTSDTPATPKT